MEGRTGETRLPSLLTSVFRRPAGDRTSVRVLRQARSPRHAGTRRAKNPTGRTSTHNSLEESLEHAKPQSRVHHLESPPAPRHLRRDGRRIAGALLSPNPSHFEHLQK